MKKMMCLIAVAMLILCSGCGKTQQDPSLTYPCHRFLWQDLVIRLHDEAEPVLEALGAPKSYTEEASCAFDGVEKTYYYGSFYLSTYPLEGKDYIFRIWFADDSVSTEEGIRIGNTQAEVETVCGSGCFSGTNAYTQVKGDSKLTILLTDGTVSSIQYEVMID